MTIFYILVAVIVGWFIGFLDSNLRTAKKIEAAETTAEMMIEEAQKKTAQLEKKIAAGSPLQDDPGLLRLKKRDGRFLLELDGEPVTGELSLDMRKRLMELITVFRLWLETGQSSSVASQPVASSRASRPAVPDPLREAIYGSTETVSQPLSAPEADYASTQPVFPKPLSPVKKSEVEKNIASMSIVQQIDTILQERMMDTSLAKRGIRLQESAQGGAEVYVGLQKFLSVDDVPDEVVKNTIRAAIAEWEQKYTPGM